MNINEIVMKLLIEQPFYGYVASSVTFAELKSIDTMKLASPANLKIYYNPEWFETLDNDGKIGAVLHELLHIILLHQFRRMNRESMVWSVACDMAVNEMIAARYLPKGAVTVSIIQEKLKIPLEHDRNAEYYYDRLTDTDDISEFISMEGDSVVLFEEENKLVAEKLSDETASRMEANALKCNLSQLMEQAEMEEEIPPGLMESIEEVYQDLHVNWRVILKRFLSGRGKIVTRKSYKRQSRRYDNLPGTKRSIGVNALLAIDESGSISDALVKKFYQELNDINKITGVSILVTRFDTKCSEPVSLSRFIIGSKREKRGGTDFKPIFKLADELRIPLVIIFTDGDGEAPDSVNQNTLWVLTKGGHKPADYGAAVTFEG